MTKNTNKTMALENSEQVQKNEHSVKTSGVRRSKKVIPALAGVALLTATIYSGVSTVQKQSQVSTLKVQVEKQDEQIKKLNLTLDKQQSDYVKSLQESNAKLEETKQEVNHEKQKAKKVTKQYKKKYNNLKQKHKETKNQLNSTKKQNKVLKQKVALKKRAITLASNPVKNTTHHTSTSSTNSSKTITVTATAYTAHCDSCSGITASGVNVRHSTPNLIAVDPRVVPLGKHVELIANGKSLGTYLAGDTGGAIKGNKIDILVSSDAEAFEWGVRTVTLKVLD